MKRAGIVLLIASLPLIADQGIKEGKWEFTTDMGGMKMPAMPELPPGVKLPPGMELPKMSPKGMTFTHCVTQEDAVPRNESNDDCKVTRMDRKGNTIKWAMVCDGEDGKMTGEGETTYTGDTVKSVMHMKGQTEHGPMDITQTTTGRYLGPCTKKS